MPWTRQYIWPRFFLIATGDGPAHDAAAAYHRLAERGCVTQRFIHSCFRTDRVGALLPLLIGLALDLYPGPVGLPPEMRPRLLTAGDGRCALHWGPCGSVFLFILSLPRAAGARNAMRLVLLDRDGVVVVNRATNIKGRKILPLSMALPRGIGRLNAAGLP